MNKIQIYRGCGCLGDPVQSEPITNEAPLMPTNVKQKDSKISDAKLLRIQRMAAEANILLPIEFNKTIKS